MLTVEVPLNTMLADLDETLRGMLKSELERHGFEGIEIAFDAPTREWSGQLSAPAVNLFLYDMRESEEERPSGWTKQRVGDEFVEGPPPMVMEVSYAITAWAQAVEDEHRLLSQVLAVLYAYPHLPEDALNGRLRNGSQSLSIKTKVGQAKGDKADFWTAVGGQYKVSLDYVVRLTVESGVPAQGAAGPDADRPHPPAGRAGARGRRDAPRRRHGRRRRRRAAARTCGSPCPTRACSPRPTRTGASASTAWRRDAPSRGPLARRQRRPRRTSTCRARCWISSSTAARPRRAAGRAASADDRTGR